MFLRKYIFLLLFAVVPLTGQVFTPPAPTYAPGAVFSGDGTRTVRVIHRSLVWIVGENWLPQAFWVYDLVVDDVDGPMPIQLPESMVDSFVTAATRAKPAYPPPVTDTAWPRQRPRAG